MAVDQSGGRAGAVIVATSSYRVLCPSRGPVEGFDADGGKWCYAETCFNVFGVDVEASLEAGETE